MKNEKLWSRFEASGSVSDYLAYVQAQAEEESNAEQDDRYDLKTARYRRE